MPSNHNTRFAPWHPLHARTAGYVHTSTHNYTITAPPTDTPQPPTDTPTAPPDTPIVPPPPPPTPEPPPTLPPPTIPPTVDPYGTPFRDPEGRAVPVAWPPLVSYEDHPFNPTRGIDLVPATHRGGGDAAIGFTVVALRSGHVTSDYDNPELNVSVGPHMVAITGENHAYELVYSHIIPRDGFPGTFGVFSVNVGDVVGTIMDIREEDPALVNSLDSHLHIQLREPAWGSVIDPSGLITSRGY